ncbi:MAG: ROK family protein [Anaerolineae bacterium]
MVKEPAKGPDNQRPLCLALDFGGTKLAAGLVEWRQGRLLRQARCSTSGQRGAEGQIADMLGMVAADLHLRPEDWSSIWGVGISFGGPVDVESGTVLLSHHVTGWENLALVRRIEDAYHCPVVMENDANAVALGEHLYGAGRGSANMLYLTISTGIGGGLILDNRLRRGEHGMAGEVGHMVVRPGGPLCSCGNRGCLEALASGPAIAQRARNALAAGAPAPLLLSLVGGRIQDITAQTVFSAATQGEPSAVQVIAEAADDLGLAIAMVCSIVDPGCVVIGGGVAKAGDLLLDPVRASFMRFAFPMVAERVRIIQAQALDEGGLLGAAALVAQNLL